MGNRKFNDLQNIKDVVNYVHNISSSNEMIRNQKDEHKELYTQYSLNCCNTKDEKDIDFLDFFKS